MSRRSRSPRRRKAGVLWWLLAAAGLATVAILPGVGASNASFLTTTSSETNSFKVYGDPVLLESVWWLDASEASTVFTDTGCTTPAINPGDPVACWVDRLDSSARTIAFSATSTGSISTTTIGGNRTLTFPGTTDLRGPDRLGGSTNNMTIFVVAQANAYTNNFLVSLNGTDSGSTGRFTVHLPYSNHSTYFDAGGCCTTNRSISGSAPLDTPLLFTGWKDSVAGYSYHTVNDIGIAQSAGNTAAPTTGGLRLGVNANHQFAELIVFNRTLTAAERDAVQQYLKGKWGIA